MAPRVPPPVAGAAADARRGPRARAGRRRQEGMRQARLRDLAGAYGSDPDALLADMGGYLDQASRRSLCLYII